MDYVEYYQDREKKKDLGYRLRRRTYEVIKAIMKHKGKQIGTVLDVGCAEGLMLQGIAKKIRFKKAIGIDNNPQLLKLAKKTPFKLINADAHKIPLPANSIDVIVATAVIEHVKRPRKVMQEFRRVLRKGGICILTSPNPVFDTIGSFVGLLKDDTHYETFNLKKLKKLLKSQNFKVLEAKRFMISPIGCPGEIKIEKVLRKTGLSFTMCNQLIVGKK
jgi:ubiquinone/menaquinone biosynthesis C-methylase UbiE